jgi:hypothetical protein
LQVAKHFFSKTVITRCNRIRERPIPKVAYLVKCGLPGHLRNIFPERNGIERQTKGREYEYMCVGRIRRH